LLHSAPSNSARMTIYRRLGVHTSGGGVGTPEHTHTWCIPMHSRLTLRLWGLSNHALRHQHPTGQGQNRALSVKKKKKSNRLSVAGSIHVGTLTRPMCMGRRVRLTVRVWRLLDHALYQQYPTGQGQNRTPSVKKKTKSNRMSGGRLFIYGHSHTHQHTRRALARVSQWM